MPHLRNDTIIGAFNTYWRSLAAGRPPERSQFDPLQMPQAMPTLLLMEIEAETARLRYRLTGSQSDEYAGVALTGRYLDEFFSGKTERAARFFETIYRRIARTAVPEIGCYDWPAANGLTQRIVFGVFPLLVDGAVRQFVCIEDYTEVYGPGRELPWSIGPIEAS